MKVLVTGATGFIGQRVVGRLQEAGFDIRVASRRPEQLPAADDAVPLPATDAADEAFLAVMSGVTHVVHCAALNNERRASDADYQAINATLTGRLAKAAAACGSGRFIYLSSIRAVAGPGFSGTISEATPPAPQCAYGRSKREGETRMAEAYAPAGRADATALRLPPVYGDGMRGNLASLMRLADTALPLPAGVLAGLRSLIASETAASAVLHLLSRPGPLRPAYVAGNASPLAMSEIITAFRQGLGRPPRLLPVPALPLRLAATLFGRQASWQALTATQICDPSLLVSEGWAPETDTLDRLRDLARKEAGQAR
ncbi:NAD-dependent epimerase/dehydratase family protein [Mesorhizobium sp.]|uniref:NAD-dependent epimerase/dehydratase family protein n=1 Tax=Mesorhizobium sp. TaxID=1871066 RepID=UPI000FE33084|nr:NAD-dependent epimerase/dehydratase family protein [Mesorhizobium sp.]RWG85009.1 MAG: NAD-dependent epimerase/dehydratase family protein [Mesorhizobium sp.]RWK16793.1 MAG: NAD-dependent epimerase/dehydratase family protein [Mesorhizobium sp.]TIQ47614.1 MAG: NAD-dependent epimerase/dehydratase family protein [Mesorhizobium sp.]TIQ55690.1 MAG: NAD-dependent epimerase/dehydratase family protein [Mesorhizobium sp.]